ncbi:DNA methyltransferase [Marinobacter nauticus]|uniref:site-specific DNA-methyltransferase (adenine-specific) n=1 Tax=Marinobacter nauticus TaxID=2743 RepID=A0A833JNA5_MARNT|nr:DNA methyltransferase [Marinobacter nauticus]KAE8545027.1 Type II restriction enzyme, methylase subunit YeeA [Marinobacter nauticus]
MAISQARIIESMEQACSNLNPDEFIFSFLDAYGFPKSTITRLRKGDDSRNVASGGDIGLKKKLYFRSVPEGADLNAEADALKANEVVSRNDIRFVIVTDFKSLVALDLKAEERLETTMDELDKQYAFFLPLAGYEKAVMYSEHPADVKASEKMGRLFDLIRERNDLSKPGDIHALNVFLTRLLFCFYAEDTGIFAQGQMTSAIQSTTKEDGSDLDQFFSDLFTVLNLDDKAPERASMAAHFQDFPYVNGGLFEADEPIPEFGKKARRLLIDCGNMDWSEINPDIFGSMFQAVIDEEKRGSLGQHYTSVSNIMKVIQPLFLDKLYEELEKSRKSERKLKELLVRLQNLRIFDPACGSGNFLIIAYKELRKLEMEVIDALNAISGQSEMYYSGIRLSQFFGIEIDDFAHEVAILSLWLAEHQMNMAFKAKFGYAEAALPLRDSGNIVCGNALRLDWKDVCPPVDGSSAPYEVYVCGNPPFLGNGGRNAEQNADMAEVFSGFKSFGVLDLVACWFWKGAKYIAGKKAEFSFVSTNSICQGDQVGVLWPAIFDERLKIRFAYQTFTWKNNAKQNAGVHVVVIGLSNAQDVKERLLFKNTTRETVHCVLAQNINPYLLDAKDTVVQSRTRPLSGTPMMVKGSQPTDGGHLLLSSEEKNLLIEREPKAQKWIKKLIGAQEFLQAKERWCLWLAEATPEDIEGMPLVKQRVEAVRETRLASRDSGARRLAEKPHQFRETKNPDSFMVVPSVSSERRDYIPMGLFGSDVISTNLNLIIPDATPYEFGILTSEMHNDWMRAVAGRLESRYRYSATLVYNTFPWPEINDRQRKKIEELAEEVLLVREDYPDKSLADLYDPDKMPEPLRDAHKALDRAVEKLYRDKPFRDATERLERLFALYEKLIAEEEAQKPAKKTAKGSN